MSAKNEKTVLIVEDRANWRETFANFLQSTGYKVIEATCGEEFLLFATKASIIILDITLPNRPGGPEIRTEGLDRLFELQKSYPEHKAIQNPIIRSMWNQDLFGTKYKNLRVSPNRWLSRETPIAELMELIENT